MTRLFCVAAMAQAAYLFAARGGCGTEGALACPPPELEQGVGVTLKASKVCPRAGYLCRGRARFQVRRWSLEKGRLRVRIPLPDHIDGVMAQKVQSAAIDGIKVWDGHPFPIIIDTGPFSFRSSDVKVVWSRNMGGSSQLGDVDYKVKEKGKRLEFMAPSFRVLVPPDAGADTTSLERIKDVATHEMGHALGVSWHSEQESDIMFYRALQDPKQARVSKRDFLTFDALYKLPNGAIVQ